MNKYYVYILIDSSNSQPFYVGKGQGDRMLKHLYDAQSRDKHTGEFIHHKPHHVHIRRMCEAGVEIVYHKDLESVTQTQALNRERELIERIGRKITNTGPLLNISKGGQIGGETCKPVTQYTLDMTPVATYPSAKVASESVHGANRSYITQCCKRKRVSAGGFLWSYENDSPQPYAKKYYKAVEQYSSQGDFIAKYDSLTEAQRVTGVELHNISECCRGKSKTAGGFVWQYSNQ